CEAVQYAHQHLIIHRDLKPGNVLVTPAGDPKLVDFGIARSRSQAIETAMGERIMTLAYASPEQLSGKPLSAAPAAYSLGVMLYELLAGQRRWEEHEDPLVMARMMGQTEPQAPSTARRRNTRKQSTADNGAGGPKWRLALPNRLPKDLDAIVLKALRLK